MNIHDARKRVGLESDEFIASIDRSVLGLFAVPENALRAASHAHIAGSILDNSGDSTERATMAALRVSFEGGVRAIMGVGYKQAYRELSYWLYKSGDFVNEGDEESEGIKRFELIASSPAHFHPYFRAGIWDAVVIERLIYDGIDPELGASALSV